MSDPASAARAALRSAGIGPGCRVLAAVSGGPDSTALLITLADQRSELGFHLDACVVDHGIRDARDRAADVEFLRGVCARLGVPLLVKTVPPGTCARDAAVHRMSPEEAAREARHARLKEAARETGASVIALGHTEDDLVETLLMRVLQGSDVHGLRGIAFRRGPYLRPLLRCRRTEVLDYLRSQGQTWREDRTNREVRFLRNRVRHRLMPLLDKEFPGFRTALRTLSRKMRLSSDLVRARGSSLRWERAEDGFAMSSEEFFGLHPAIRAWSLLSLYDRFRPHGAPRRLPWRFVAPVLRMATPPPRDGTILLGNGCRLAQRSGLLHWGPHIVSRSKKGYFIAVSEARNTEIREAGVSVGIARGPDAGGRGGGGNLILAAKVQPPIVLRSKRRGDVIRLAGGATSVNKLLNGMKVPGGDRDRVPILADRGGVVAVLGSVLGYRTRARAEAPTRPGAEEVRLLVGAMQGDGRGT